MRTYDCEVDIVVSDVFADTGYYSPERGRSFGDSLYVQIPNEAFDLPPDLLLLPLRLSL